MCVVSKVWSFIKPGGRSARTKNQTLSEAIENHSWNMLNTAAIKTALKEVNIEQKKKDRPGDDFR